MDMHTYQAPAQSIPQAQPAHPEQRNTIQCTLDKEAKDLLSKVHPELRNSFISIAVKAFSEDILYKKFFLDKSLLPPEEVEQVESEIQQAPVNQAEPAQQAAQTVAQPQPQAQPEPSFQISMDGW